VTVHATRVTPTRADYPARAHPSNTLVVAEPDQPSRARVVGAEDDVLMREGVTSLLERGGYEVVGQAGDGSELLLLVREQRPDLPIVDIRMPPSRSSTR